MSKGFQKSMIPYYVIALMLAAAVMGSLQMPEVEKPKVSFPDFPWFGGGGGGGGGGGSEPEPDQPPIPSSGEILWSSRDPRTGFEGGDVDNVWQSGGGQKFLEDDSSGSMQSLNNRVGNLPESGAYVERTIVYRGNVAVRLEATHRSQLNRYDAHDVNEVYSGVAIYLPPGFQVEDWCLLFQFHAKTGVFVSLRMRPDGRLMVKMNYPKGNKQVLWVDTVQAPVSSWFTVIMYVRTTADGEIKVWVNKNPYVFSGAGVLVGSWKRNLEDPQRKGPSTMIDVYQAPGSGRNTVYFDEWVIATSLESCVDFLGGG